MMAKRQGSDAQTRRRSRRLTALALLVALAAALLAPAASQAQTATCPCTIFGTSAPSGQAVSDGTPIEVGVKFRASENGFITGLRFYKQSNNTGTHVGHLWSAGGQQLAEVTYSGESASGWQTAQLSNPVQVTAGTTYVASYWSASGMFAFTGGTFQSPVTNGPLTALADGTDGGNGVFRYGASGLPTGTFNASNYWVDVVFEQSVAADTTPPTVTSTSPADAATGVAVGTTVQATFSEAMDAATLTSSTVTLRTSGGTLVPATVAYNASARTVTLTPSSALANSATYTARIAGGSGGASDTSGNALESTLVRTFTTAAPAPGTNCPCNIFGTTAPSGSAVSDGTPIEVGVKFRASENGFITGLRFYKQSNNTGTHVGHLWSSDGQQLAEATFVGESGSGWQEVDLTNPVAVTAGTTYVASYWSSAGWFAYSPTGLAAAVTTGPLSALADGADGSNGVYRYGASGFPTASYNASNYWVDVTYQRTVAPDTTPPTVSSTSPSGGASNVAIGTTVQATFSEAIDGSTVTGTNVRLTAPGGTAVSGEVVYSAATRSAILTPSVPLATETTYTATIRGGSSGIADTHGNRLAGDVTWTFTTAAPAPPPPNEGPGGPILVLASPSDPYGKYYAEILRAEGLNEFTVSQAAVSSTLLADYQTVILASATLNATQVSDLTSWVQGGGNLIAMRPDKALAPLLGLTDAGSTLANAYLRVSTSTRSGAGIIGDTIQFHGTADRYTLNGASTVATLHSNATTATTNPAVTLRSVGSAGGQAATFAYDLARSIVQTRQGNPAWSGQKRDGTPGPIRPDDAFYPNWIDISKQRIPQADEQQRLLANLITEMNLDKAPLPRFWYLPDGDKAAVVMTGDDHGNNGTSGQFDRWKAASPAGCSVVNWECVRATSYIYPGTPITDAQAAAYQAEGFELSLHLNTLCNDYNESSLAQQLTQQLSALTSAFPSLAPAATNRTHCVAWSDWAGTPKVLLSQGIRLDTTFYQLGPQGWFTGAGSFTGSHMPMRFANTDGSMIDVYQAHTQLPDELNEIGLSLPRLFSDYMDDALGSKGYYGVFTVNAHTDYPDSADADNIVAQAQENGVPVVSAKQMLQWLDGRNASSFGNIAFDGSQLTFSVTPGAGVHGLRGMLPVDGPNGKLSQLRRDGVVISRTVRTIKGVDYAMFPAGAGNYVATYATDAAAPDISELTATADDDGRATVRWQTDEASTSRVDFGTAPTALTRNVVATALDTDHVIELNNLTPGATYYVRVTSVDAAGNSATSPAASQSPISFETTAQRVIDTRVDDFDAGTDSSTAVGASGATNDGEVQLAAAERQEFEGTALPSSWNAAAWATGGTTSVSGGALRVNGARASTNGLFGAGRVLEFSATLANAPDQSIGLGDDLTNYPLAVFSTGDSSNETGLYAWTGEGDEQRTKLTGITLGVPHRYRIEWSATGITYFVDGQQVAAHTLDVTRDMRPVVSDGTVGGASLAVQWLRLGGYATAGTFTSRVLDGTADNRDWSVLATTTLVPSGTTLTFQARTGNSASPDGTWTSWQSVAANGTIPNANGRYLQYRASFTSAGGTSTPTLQRVEATYDGGLPANRAPIAGSVSISPASPTTNQTVTATPSGFSDPDGDPISYRYQWLRNGTPIEGATSSTLDLSVAGNGNRSDVIRVDVVGVDPLDATSSTVSSQQTVANSGPVVAPGASASVVYSDQLTPIAITAVDPDGDAVTAITASGLPSGLTLTNNGGGSATISGRPTSAAGTYNATITASDGNRAGTATQQIVVTKETAAVGYVGDIVDTTNSSFSNVGTISASAVVTQQADGLAGDITRASVVFELYSGTNVDGSPDRTCTDSTVSSTGGASCDISSVSTGDWTMVARSAASNGYYTSAASDSVLVTMYRRGTTRTFTSTNGAIIDPSFNNLPVAIAPAPNNQGQFTFSVRYATGSNTTPLSSATSTYQFRGVDGNRYVLTTTSWTGGGMYFNSSGGGAGWAAVGTVQAFNASNQVVAGLGGTNMRFRVDVIDGSPDRYAISVYTSAGVLYHRAGTKSAPITLASGSITSS